MVAEALIQAPYYVTVTAWLKKIRDQGHIWFAGVMWWPFSTDRWSGEWQHIAPSPPDNGRLLCFNSTALC